MPLVLDVLVPEVPVDLEVPVRLEDLERLKVPVLLVKPLLEGLLLNL